MKKFILFILAAFLLESCSEQIFDPTRSKDATKAKKTRQEHTKGFAGPN